MNTRWICRFLRLKEFYLRCRCFGNQKDKFILCRPRGGLNDTLCQIQRCREYAIRSGRSLWVDSTRSGFQDCLSNYFEEPVDFHFGSPASAIPVDATCYPHVLTNQYESYKYKWAFPPLEPGFVESKSGVPITFNFNKLYSEELLVHEQSGGGRYSIRMLECLSMRSDLRKYIRDTIVSLGIYDAIHVRNTDLKTDYKEFFNRIHKEVRGKVVLCTDDRVCQEYAKTFFGKRLFVLHDLPNTEGKSLHESDMGTSLRREINRRTLLDLFVLASSNVLHTQRTESSVFSGFSFLAKSLHQDKRLCNRILSGN